MLKKEKRKKEQKEKNEKSSDNGKWQGKVKTIKWKWTGKFIDTMKTTRNRIKQNDKNKLIKAVNQNWALVWAT